MTPAWARRSVGHRDAVLRRPLEGEAPARRAEVSLVEELRAAWLVDVQVALPAVEQQVVRQVVVGAACRRPVSRASAA